MAKVRLLLCTGYTVLGHAKQDYERGYTGGTLNFEGNASRTNVVAMAMRVNNHI